MELSYLLELLYTARNRFSSIQVAWKYCYIEDVMTAAFEKWMTQHSPGSVKSLRSKSTGKAARLTPDKPEIELIRRVWWQKPESWRYEENRLADNITLIKVIRADRFWNFSSAPKRVYTNVHPEVGQGLFRLRKRKKHPREGFPSLEEEINDVPIVDPSFLLFTHEFQQIEDATYLGRDTLQVRGAPRKGRKSIQEPYFWSFADGYEFLVDKERGILLYYAALIGGKKFAIASVEQVVFDERIPDHIFTFTPPEGSVVEVVS
jgi:hypothetical protein